MDTTGSVTADAVTTTVAVRFETAQQKADRLDAEWHLESWSPEAAAMKLAEDVLSAGGLHHAAGVSVSEVRGGHRGTASSRPSRVAGDVLGVVGDEAQQRRAPRVLPGQA